MNALSKLIRATTTLRQHGRATRQLAGAALLLSFATSLACGGLDDSGLTSSIESALCRSDRGCSGDDSGDPGASASACRSDVDCAVGLECEVEHGAGFCKPHGGDRNNSSGNGSGGSGGSHDNSAGSGGSHDNSRAPACEEDEDCAADERCESIGNSQRACFADNDSGHNGSE